MEVSAHAGARPEHAAWQGKVYSRSGTSEKYPDFRSSTGYGTGAGLCGWNCRHTFGPYIEGSPRVWTDEKLAELSATKYEYQGEKYTEYEARQKEKYFDRQIYRWQREAEAMRAAGQDPAQALAKVKAWERRKSDFVLNRAELAVAKPKNSGIIKSLDIDDFYLMAEGHEIHQDVLDVIADVISEYEREGKAFFSETEFGEFYDSATGKPALLQTDINSYGMLKLNVNSSILAGRTLEEIDAQIARTDSNLPNSLREAVVHECGHAKAYKGKTPKEISAMNESLSNRGVDGIGPIAEMDGAECIAEIEVMLYRGEQVSDAAMHLYNEFITE